MSTIAPESVTQTGGLDAAAHDPDIADVRPFLLAHKLLRHEFARLSLAAASAATKGAQYSAIEHHIDLVARILHHHHVAEDVQVWPYLLKKRPEAGADLAALEAEHHDIDPVVAAVTDRSIPLTERAAALAQLSDALNAHLDHEERVAIPLITELFTVDDWEAVGKQIMKQTRSDLPMQLCMMLDHMTPEETAGLFAGAPKVLTVLYKISWRRTWAKKRALVYGR